MTSIGTPARPMNQLVSYAIGSFSQSSVKYTVLQHLLSMIAISMMHYMAEKLIITLSKASDEM